MSSQAESRVDQVMPEPENCVVCGQVTRNREGGLVLCYEHAAVARRLAKVATAQTPFDLITSRSHGVREHPDGRPTTYDLTPARDVEQVVRDVTVSIYNVPLFAAEALYHRLHNEVGRPDVEQATATIELKLEGLHELEYARLEEFEKKYWVSLEYETVRTRLYPPRHLMDAKIKQVDRRRAEQREAETA